MTGKIPSQQGFWTVVVEGGYFVAYHSEWERATDEGGPLTAYSTSLGRLLREVVDLEIETTEDVREIFRAVESARGFPENSLGTLELADLMFFLATGRIDAGTTDDVWKLGDYLAAALRA